MWLNGERGDGRGNLERFMVCLKRKRVLMGHAHSLWILTTSQNVTQGEGELRKRIWGGNREAEGESDKYRTDSVPWPGPAGGGLSLSLSTGGQNLPMSQPLGREAHSWLVRLL